MLSNNILSDTQPLSSEILSQAAAQPTIIERRDNLSYEEFVHEYQIPRRPVIITDAMRDWKAREWTPEHLIKVVGSREIEFRGGTRPWAFDELMVAILAGCEENPAPYARNLDVARALPELLPDITPRLKYAVPDWKSSRLLPKDWLFPNGLEEMFIGGLGTRFPFLHIDYYGMDGFISQIYGDKEFLVFAKSDSPYLYAEADDPITSTIKDFDNPDYERFPLLRQATPIRFTVRAGETFYQPNGWWHTTKMLGVSIAVVTATWNASNWPVLVEEIGRRTRQGRGLAGQAKAALYTTYLRGVGAVLGARERLPLAV